MLSARLRKQRLRPIRVDGDVAYVPLTQGKTAIIDACDVPLIADRAWCLLQTRDNYCSVVGYTRTPDGRYRAVPLARVIIGPNERELVDHIDGDTLNNRRRNLRIANNAQNAANRGPTRANSTGYKGVSYQPSRGKFIAVIRADGKHRTLGRFDDPASAARAYDHAAVQYFGEFAWLNFPQKETACG